MFYERIDYEQNGRWNQEHRYDACINIEYMKNYS